MARTRRRTTATHLPMKMQSIVQQVMMKAQAAVRNQPEMTVITPEMRYTALSLSQAPSANDEPMATMKVT